MRYHRNGEPLWVSDEGKPSDGDIPVCDCGSERVFEFQVDGFEIFIMFSDGTFSFLSKTTINGFLCSCSGYHLFSGKIEK